jgi:hypothetical protein
MWQEEMKQAIETLKSLYGSVQQSGRITNISLESFHRIVPTWSKKFVLNIYTKESGIGYLVFRETCSSNIVLILRRLERLLPLLQTFENLGLNVNDLVYKTIDKVNNEQIPETVVVPNKGITNQEVKGIKFTNPKEVGDDFLMYNNLLINWVTQKVIAQWNEETQSFEKTTKKFSKTIRQAIGL